VSEELTDNSDAPWPWPSSNDELFGRDNSHRRAVAHVAGDWGSNPYIYATGYREGAEILVQNVVETGRHQDFLVYPIMALHRQYVELRLKHIAVEGAWLIDQPAPSEIMGRHELKPLWDFCRLVLVERAGGEPSVGLDDAERILEEIIRADPASYAFRYPTDKQGNRSLPPDLVQVDLQRVRDVMAGLGNLLDIMLDYIEAEVDAKQEWLVATAPLD